MFHRRKSNDFSKSNKLIYKKNYLSYFHVYFIVFIVICYRKIICEIY